MSIRRWVSFRSCALVLATFLITLGLSPVILNFTHSNLAKPEVSQAEQMIDAIGPANQRVHLEPRKLEASIGASRSSSVDKSEADRLKQTVRVMIWVMTSPSSIQRAQTVKSTWGQRADKDMLLFFSSQNESTLPTVALNVAEGRNHLLAKTMQAFDYLHKHYFHKAEFFMKVDDDTYVVMENLRYFLSGLNPKEPFITGRHFKHHVKQGFPSGGAGYVLSKEALSRFANRSKDPPLCKEDGPTEDVELSRCMEKLGVSILNSSDSRGRSRFHPYTPMHHVVKGMGPNYTYWDANIVRVGPHAINDYPISFHYIRPDEMKLLHYFIYNVRPYGISYRYSTT